MSLGNFYLDVASRALTELSRLKGRATSERITRTGKWLLPSSHYRYAVTCIVFSTVAVEHELSRLIHIRIVIQSEHQSRRLLMAIWPKRPRIDDMLAFIRSASRVDRALLGEIRTLFNDRNRIVHAGKSMHLSEHPLPTGGVKWEAGFDLPQLRSEWLTIARRDVGIARKAVTALRGAITEDEWRTARLRHRAPGAEQKR